MQNLKSLRDKIQKIDAKIIKNLAKRQKLSQQIGELKKKSKIAITDDMREKQLMTFYEQLSKQYNLDPVFVKKLFEIVISHSKKLQDF